MLARYRGDSFGERVHLRRAARVHVLKHRGFTVRAQHIHRAEYFVYLSFAELRARSAALMKQIADFIAADEAHIVEQKAKLELAETSLSDKEKISKDIDTTTKRIDDKIEQKLDEILPEAFAIMKDTARRFAENDTVVVTATDFDRNLAAEKDFVTIDGDKAVYATHWMAGGNDIKWDMVHYDVQLFGGVVLHKGKIAEMATGEGKTLVATLPVFLNAMARKGVHVVTVNDYLARRDSEWMGPMYEFHGLSVDCIDKHQPNSEARRKAYMADITFGTNNEYGFDYLRDNMASSPKDLVQRKHHYAIVDEVDSVLIDDARTPLGCFLLSRILLGLSVKDSVNQRFLVRRAGIVSINPEIA